MTQLLQGCDYRLWRVNGFDGTWRPEVSIAERNSVAIPAKKGNEYERFDA
ncbi:hypothetical protein N9850_01570 [Granulosicoccus sp.]|nr:hypothetical protein [Granulosicoccus sp.]MDB4222430.1 hypothetical protein [Granulosicoccus sp.]